MNRTKMNKEDIVRAYYYKVLGGRKVNEQLLQRIAKSNIIPVNVVKTHLESTYIERESYPDDYDPDVTYNLEYLLELYNN